MQQILVNDRLLREARTGVGHYLASLVAHWPTGPQVSVEPVGFHFQRLLNRSGVPGLETRLGPLDGIEPVRLRPLRQLHPPRSGWQRRLLEPLRPLGRRFYSSLLAREWSRGGYVAFFEPNSLPTEPLQPTITTIQDLSVLEVPEFHPPQRVRLWQRWLDFALRSTRHWICISQGTADAMTRVLGVRSADMTVIPLASRWPGAPAAWDPAAARRQLQLPERYLVYLGTLEPRKNLVRLLDAYAQTQANWRQATPLILAGMPGWGQEDFWQALREHPTAEQVFFTGYLTDAQAAALVYGALTLLYPSLYEGFGLPPLEAMALGVPVVASTAEAIKEVCEGAAILVDPGDTDGWTEAMVCVTEPGLERERLIAAGKRRARDFCWKETARQHHQLFARLAG